VRYSHVLTAVATTALAAGALAAVQPAQAAPLSGAAAAEQALRAAGDKQPTIRKDRAGLVRSVIAQPGHPLRAAKGIAAKSTPESAARGFLNSYGAAFGLRDTTASSLKTVRTDRTAEGDRIVRFQQQLSGVPVIGGDVVVATRSNGDVLSATSEVTTEATTPTATRIPRERAIAVAINAAAGQAKVPAKQLVAEASRWMYDPAMLGAPTKPGLRPVWQVDVTSPKDSGLQHRVLVDGTLGNIVLATDDRHNALNRTVCDYGNQKVTEFPCEAWNATRSEGQGPSTVADVNKAYDYSNSMYEFYYSNFGRDSIDGAGMPLRSSVRICVYTPPGWPPVPCPYPNAFWDGEKMVYGAGFASADDVVGHELSHGVTQYTSNLYYAFQSGAINESMSDVFGEFIDQKAVWPGTKDGAAYDWQLGEDMPIGAIRSMADPTLFGDPDKMTSPNYFGYQSGDGGAYPADSGGVHYNSGIGNKAAYLMTAPGTRTFNGVSVTGLGIDKAAQIYYRTQLMLTSGADYADLAATLDSACQQLATAGTKDITADDCVQVRNATTATEMTKQPTVPWSTPTPEAPVCPTNTAPAVFAGDDLEDATAGKWSLTGPNWVHPVASDPNSYTYSGRGALYGRGKDDVDDAYLRASSATLNQPIAVPAGKTSYLRFAHADFFQITLGKYIDGGRVEYSSDGGAWTDAGPLITDNGYNVNLAPDAGAGTGRFFGSYSKGYTASRLNLTSLGGHNVKFRFSIYGNDSYYSEWFIDEVKAYTCKADRPGAVTGLTSTGGLNSATLKWSPPTIEGPAPVTEYKITANPAIAGLPATVPAGQPLTLPVSGLTVQWYQFTVTPMAGEAPGTPTTLLLKTSSVAVAATPSTVVNTKPTSINGTVSLFGGGVATSGIVTVFGRAKGTTAWAKLGTAPVATTGKFAFKHVPPKNFEYTVEYTGGTSIQGAKSGVVTALLSPFITLSAAPSTVTHGGSVRFAGAIYPGRAAPVTLQFQLNGVWYNVATGTTAANGSYSITAKLFRVGRYNFRVVSAANAEYTTGISGNWAITIR
jgi:Zn-dependent metalloprotease